MSHMLPKHRSIPRQLPTLAGMALSARRRRLAAASDAVRYSRTAREAKADEALFSELAVKAPTKLVRVPIFSVRLTNHVAPSNRSDKLCLVGWLKRNGEIK
jgi:hypothetical protein